MYMNNSLIPFDFNLYEKKMISNVFLAFCKIQKSLVPNHGSMVGREAGNWLFDSSAHC